MKPSWGAQEIEETKAPTAHADRANEADRVQLNERNLK
jgi:hypothetical protein